MTEEALLYARQLQALDVPRTVVQQTQDILDSVPALLDQLGDPAVELRKKHLVIDKVFPLEMRDFLKILCDKGDTGLLNDIFPEFFRISEKPDDKLHARLLYVTPPSDAQLDGIRDYLVRKYGREDIVLEPREDPSLISGFKIVAGDEEIDWSARGRVEQLQQKISGLVHQESTENIVSILRASVEDFQLEVKSKEVGTVKSVGDGIAVIDGLDHAVYGEIVIFDSGVKGMVQDIRRSEIGCILFGADDEVAEGTRVVRTGKTAGVSVGDGYLGRVVNALGAPVDGLGTIAASGYNPIEAKAPAIMDRKGISVPMDTGLLVIDSMFPIGRGQRELIIGDRETGKTAIALDTILNQRDKNVICVYVAIGQKSSNVSKIVGTLKRFDALGYCVVVSSTASDPAPLQYIAPYSGCAIAEYFMRQGRDVLIVYDDLSKHAVAYRALSLLLGRSPGREAYPGDVFYLHSRLLERAARLSPENGGGSLTALPIIETQAGDVSAYIPTNVISITDGQIFLESDLYFSGQRPAVNVGLSVSRVGGDAQTKAMRKAAGAIRLDLAQYREMEVFTQFSSELDNATREQLRHGAALMQLLKQPQYRPMNLHEQVITLIAANDRAMKGVPVKDVKSFQREMLSWFESVHPELCRQIEDGKELPDELRGRITEALGEFRAKRNG